MKGYTFLGVEKTVKLSTVQISKASNTMDHFYKVEALYLADFFSKNEFIIGFFLDIRKAIGKWYWHEIRTKMHAYCIRGNLTIFVHNFFKNKTFRCQVSC